jgi:hypothetical protein
MTNLPAIVRATRASANALDAMARHARAAADAAAVIESNNRMVAFGVITPTAAAIGNRVAVDAKNRATMQWHKARGRYERANLKLKRNPI